MGCPAAIVTSTREKTHHDDRGSAHLKSIRPSRVFTQQHFIGRRTDEFDHPIARTLGVSRTQSRFIGTADPYQPNLQASGDSESLAKAPRACNGLVQFATR